MPYTESTLFRMIFIAFFVVGLDTSAISQETKVADDSTGAKQADSIIELNTLCREVYANARSHKLAESGAIIHVTGDALTLIHQGKHIEGSKVHHNYHDLKTFAHVPMAVYLCLGPYGEGDLSRTQIDSLTKLLSKIDQVSPGIESRFEDAKLAQRQKALLEKCQQFVESTLVERSYRSQDLDSFVNSCQPQIRENVRLSVRMRIDNYHNQMKTWKEKLTAEEWSQILVVISGAKMPRDDSLAVQYFAKLFQARGEGKRIVYAESVFDKEGALKILGTHLLDSDIGRDFFNNPWRMHRDLLGVEAALYLDELSLEFAP